MHELLVRRYFRAATEAACSLFLSALPLLAQNQPAEGVNQGNYNIQQTVEFGGRISDKTGNPSVYDTFVNLQSGARLYGHTLAMRSLDHQGILFDNLHLSSFGYGGDPNAGTRLRVYKNTWYDFDASFRRHKNSWNYNLLANPLNPPTSNPSLILTDSPHLFNTVRRMSDFRLILAPQSRVRVRLGYSRNVSEGPSYSSFHEGTEILLFQSWKNTVNAYEIGVDLRLLPRTSIAYTQFLNYYKGDTSWAANNFNFILANGVPADLGIIFNTAANQPCGAPIANLTTSPPTAFPGCNGFLSYSRNAASRTSTPTEQLSFESSYFANFNMAGRISYSASDNNVFGFNETSSLNASRTRLRALTSSGLIGSRRLSVTADWAGTYSITSQLRLVDEFRFQNFRIPGAYDFVFTNQFSQAPLAAGNTPNLLLPPAQFSATTGPPPFTAATCPQHSNSSGPDSASGADYRFLGQNAKYNTFSVEYDLTRRYGGRLGYRYGDRDVSTFAATVYDSEVYFPGSGAAIARRGDCALVGGLLPPGCTAMADGSVVFSGVAPGSDTEREEIPIREHSALVSLWARPTDTLRINFDGEFFYADRAFTRISPRHLQRYRVRARYRPRPWATLNMLLNIRENRNNDPQIGNLQHNRNYGFNALMEPTGRLSFDFGYEYSDFLSNSNICFALSGLPTSTTPCPVSGASPGLGVSRFRNKSNYGYFNVMWRPTSRLTATAGYSINSTTGSSPIIDPSTGLIITLNPNVPTGPLNYDYHRPSAGLALSLGRGLTWKTAWSYYGYGERALPDPTGPRSFHANLVDLSLLYSF